MSSVAENTGQFANDQTTTAATIVRMDASGEVSFGETNDPHLSISTGAQPSPIPSHLFRVFFMIRSFHFSPLVLVLLAASCRPGPHHDCAHSFGQPSRPYFCGRRGRGPAGASVGEGEWQVTDYEDRRVASVRAANGQLALGRLPVGFYCFANPDRNRLVFVGVIAPLKAATPATSPIALDVAMAWF